MHLRRIFIFSFFIFHFSFAFSQDARELVTKVKTKLNKVSDYQATGLLKTGVSFMKVPDSKVIVFYKKPDKFKISKPEGISVVPKGGVSININSLLSGSDFTAVNAGTGMIGKDRVTIIKLIPLAENTEVVISTLYIDTKQSLIRRASTTTKDNGTYEMELTYGRFAGWGLPDKVIFTFNTKDYKLPKGVTFEYDTGEPQKKNSVKNQKGTLEISYTDYTINKGVADSVFK